MIQLSRLIIVLFACGAVLGIVFLIRGYSRKVEEQRLGADTAP